MAVRRRTRARPRARRLPPAERRELLLASALRVFARRGLGEARHAEVAADARVSLATVFVYFPTREALVAAVLDEVERFLFDMAERLHARAAPAAEVLLAHAEAFAASIDSHPDHARVWLDWSTAVRADVWRRYLGFQDRMVALLARTVERGRSRGEFGAQVEPEEAARLVVGAAHTVALMKLAGRTPETVDRFLHALVRAATGSV